MENNETWRERFDEKFTPVFVLGYPNSPNLRQAIQTEFKDWFASELLSLADKIGAEKERHMIKTKDYGEVLISDPDQLLGFHAALDTAISVIKEMVK